MASQNIFLKTFIFLLFIIIIIFVSIRQVQTASLHKQATIVRDDRELHNGNGDYSFIVELSDGTRFEQNAQTLAKGESEVSGLVITGHYSFVDTKTGEIHLVEYIADEKGYRPTITVTMKKENEDDKDKQVKNQDDFRNRSEVASSAKTSEHQQVTPENNSNTKPTTTTTAATNSIPQQQQQNDENKDKAMVKSTIGDNPNTNATSLPNFSDFEDNLTNMEDTEETTPLPPLNTIASSIFSSPSKEDLS